MKLGDWIENSQGRRVRVDVAYIAEQAREAFFEKVFEFMAPGTSGDFPPDATVSFEAATVSAVQTIMRNRPTRKYYVVYEVEWTPSSSYEDDVIMDHQHDLEIADDRAVDSSLAAIGSAEECCHELQKLVTEPS